MSSSSSSDCFYLPLSSESLSPPSLSSLPLPSTATKGPPSPSSSSPPSTSRPFCYLILLFFLSLCSVSFCLAILVSSASLFLNCFFTLPMNFCSASESSSTSDSSHTFNVLGSVKFLFTSESSPLFQSADLSSSSSLESFYFLAYLLFLILSIIKWYSKEEIGFPSAPKYTLFLPQKGPSLVIFLSFFLLIFSSFCLISSFSSSSSLASISLALSSASSNFLWFFLEVKKSPSSSSSSLMSLSSSPSTSSSQSV